MKETAGLHYVYLCAVVEAWTGRWRPVMWEDHVITLNGVAELQDR